MIHWFGNIICSFQASKGRKYFVIGKRIEATHWTGTCYPLSSRIEWYNGETFYYYLSNISNKILELTEILSLHQKFNFFVLPFSYFTFSILQDEKHLNMFIEIRYSIHFAVIFRDLLKCIDLQSVSFFISNMS